MIVEKEKPQKDMFIVRIVLQSARNAEGFTEEKKITTNWNVAKDRITDFVILVGIC